MTSNKTIVITGGGRGIGRTIALHLAKIGYPVVVAARSDSDLKETSQRLSDLTQNFLAVPCDVTQVDQVQALFQKAQQLGPLYGLICAAGIYGPIGPFVENDFHEWEKALDINLKGTALTVHCAFPHLKNRGEGRVVLFSGGGQGPLPNFSSYVTAKGAIWRFTETVGGELAAHQIYLNAMAPGAVNTKFLDDLLAAGPDKVGKVFYDRAMAQKANGGQPPAKAAELCEYLMSDSARGLWGKTLSAIWDDYKSLQNLEALSATDLFQVRRVVNPQGGTRAN
jgi:NAD(P)-dependent dehydrogenase (short-subunit alcohol dehydrogenase family)